jgi:ATP synthase in type III secretion protein N
MMGTAAIGRAVDALGRPMDGGPPIDGVRIRSDCAALSPAQRCAIDVPLWTGVRCIDALLTVGRGARVGVFGAPGAGKTTLLESIVNGARADAVTIALVGERGREAQRWIERCDERTTVICATSDRPACERIGAAELAMAQACALASRGLHVLLLLDSLARYAAALREIASARGESVGRGGYPASVFAKMAVLVERAGAFRRGSVTLLASVLNDGDDRDPVSECSRSLLDGHIQLSPQLARAGRFPAIDVPASASRTMDGVVAGDHLRRARLVRAAIAALERFEDARVLGLEPADAGTAAALSAESGIEILLRQGPDPVTAETALEALAQTADMLEEA